MSNNDTLRGQGDLFQSPEDRLGPSSSDSSKLETAPSSKAPLPHRARPLNLENFLGQEHLFVEYPFLKEDNLPSLIIWGPPGCGKTTLAQILATQSGKELYLFNAVLGGVNDLKKLIARAREMKELFQKEAIIFIDEIHRFNKSQQDALLPFVEKGDFTLIGATTENPKVSVNRALLSRVHIIELKKHHPKDLFNIIKNVSQRFDIQIDDEVADFIAHFASGDARSALNILDLVEKLKGPVTIEKLETIIKKNSREYDKNHDRHYDTISAFIKSMRGSDPDSALLYLAIMLDGGEDPVFIARRLVIFASEDVGNADPMALSLATAGLQAVQNIGMPEARINLGQVTSYLASTVKSNAAYLGINEALSYVENHPTIEIPAHLRSGNRASDDYRYPHNYPHHFVDQKYTSHDIPKFYRPSEMGAEKKIKERLEKIWS